MGIVFGIAAVLLLVALAGKEDRGAPAKQTDSSQGPLPPFVKQIIVNRNASKDDLGRAALEAKEAGYPKLASALARRITGSKDNLIKSPWNDISDAAWTRFCRVIANGHEPASISPKGFYGIFQLGVRRLCDLGVLRNPRSSTENGKRVWRGTWLVPQDKFLSDPALQYKLFSKSMELFRNIISEKYAQVIGLDIEGKPATLSGLLALAHTAGSEGMYKWLMNGDIRNKFKWVTEAYNKANGIF